LWTFLATAYSLAMDGVAALAQLRLDCFGQLKALGRRGPHGTTTLATLTVWRRLVDRSEV